MIVPTRSRSICQRCRYDLQFLFERGICYNAAPRTVRHALLRQSSTPQTQKRSLSHKPRQFSPANEPEADVEGISQQRKLSEDDAVLAIQAAAIEQLEKELGKPLEQAIQEDKDLVESIARHRSTLASIVDTDERSDPVTSHRNAGASSNDVVRLARQTYGDVLPDNILDPKELALYRRLYGEPAKDGDGETRTHNLEATKTETLSENRLFSAGGEEIELQPYDQAQEQTTHRSPHGASLEPGEYALNTQAKEVALSLGGDMIEAEEPEDVEEDEEFLGIERAHPLTNMGKFGTTPRTVYFSQDGFVKPVEKIMSNYSNKHLKEMCEKTFGGPGLPDSPLTPKSARSRQQVSVPLDVNQNTMGEMEANAFLTAIMPPTYASITSVLVETRKRLGPTWLNNLLARDGGPRVLDAGAGGAGIVAWREIVQAHWNTLHSSATSSPPPATRSVVVTGSDGLRHRSAAMLENTTFIPRLPDYVHTRGTTTLEDDRPMQQRKKFDVIIAPHALLSLKEDWMRKQYVQNLWSMLSDESGVLILIEKGMPRGFEAVAGAREMLLDRYIAVPEGQRTRYSQNSDTQLDGESIHQKQTAMIVAPCTNHEKCPMYTIPGLSRGRKDICSFQQRYIRPPFLQRVLGAKDRNHDDVNFSYLSVMKGDDLRLRSVTAWDQVKDPLAAPYHSSPTESGETHRSLIAESTEGFEHVQPEPEDQDTGGSTSDPLPVLTQLPRIVYPPLKRRGHVSIDLCTPNGQIERWTIPRSFSKQAYRDARKSKWGDLWALGAKTHVARNLRLGTSEKDLIGKNGEIMKGKGRGRKERLKIKAMQMLEDREEQKMDELMEQRDLLATLDEELGLESDDTATLDSTTDISAAAKPMNNRQRKAARRAARDAQRNNSTTTTTSNTHLIQDADLTFKPRPLQTSSTRSRNVIDGDLAAEQHAMAEWEAKYDHQRAPKTGRGKRKANTFGQGSKVDAGM